MLATALTVGQSWAPAITADPPNECPTSKLTSRPESFMNSTARTVSSTLCENDPSPQSPSESPSPRLSKRSMPMPSPASCLQIRLAAGQSLPRVKPWAKTPQPRTSPSGTSMRPASSGPVLLTKLTRSATRIILSLQAAGRGSARPGPELFGVAHRPDLPDPTAAEGEREHRHGDSVVLQHQTRLS